MASNVSSMYIGGQEVQSIYIDGNLWYEKADSTILDVGLSLDTTEVHLLPSDGLTIDFMTYIYPSINAGISGMYTLISPDNIPYNLYVSDDGGFFRVESSGNGYIPSGDYVYTVKFTPDNPNNKEVINDTATFTVIVEKVNVAIESVYLNTYSLKGEIGEYTHAYVYLDSGVSEYDADSCEVQVSGGNYTKAEVTGGSGYIREVYIEVVSLPDYEATDTIYFSTNCSEQSVTITIRDPYENSHDGVTL